MSASLRRLPRAEITTLLDCALLTPGLRSLLVYDLPPDELRAYAVYAAALRKVLAKVDAVPLIQLDAGVAEDGLWSRLRPVDGHGETPLWFELSALAQPGPAVVFIPDLVRLSLPAARAALELIDADVAYLERLEFPGHIWRPDLLWIAGCAWQDVGKLSPHLLDRFALRCRISRPPPAAARREDAVQLQLAGNLPAAPKWSPAQIRRLRRAFTATPAFTAPAVARSVEYGALVAQPRPTVDLAVARLAGALARMAGTVAVRPSHVDKAAHLLGMVLPSSTADHARKPDELSQAEPTTGSQSEVEIQETPSEPPEPRGDGAEPEGAEAGETFAAGAPYSEELALVQRPADPLVLAGRSVRWRSTAGGRAIGTIPAHDLADLAVVATLLEAARFQPVRRLRAPGDERQWLFRKSDLRRYRRAPALNALLVLLVDFTAVHELPWWPVVVPALRQAYAERAVVCLVRVGACAEGGDALTLRADSQQFAGVLDPGLYAAINGSATGRATPLAHGLALSIESIRRVRGVSASVQIRLLVVSDGRGNVPLSVSYAGELPERSAPRQGLQDALNKARELRALGRHVWACVFDPQPEHYPDLPQLLADALGADLRAIPRFDEAAGDV